MVPLPHDAAARAKRQTLLLSHAPVALSLVFTRWIVTFSAVLAAGLVLMAVQWRREKLAEETAQRLAQWTGTAGQFFREAKAEAGVKFTPDTPKKIERLKADGQRLLEDKPTAASADAVLIGVSTLNDVLAEYVKIDWPQIAAWESAIAVIRRELAAAMNDPRYSILDMKAGRSVANQRIGELENRKPFGAEMDSLWAAREEISRASAQLDR